MQTITVPSFYLDKHPVTFDMSEFQTMPVNMNLMEYFSQISADGQTLVSVGGGDAIFLWQFKGAAGIDEAELVEESVRQAEAERVERLAERVRQAERMYDTHPTPSQILSQDSSPSGWRGRSSTARRRR